MEADDGMENLEVWVGSLTRQLRNTVCGFFISLPYWITVYMHVEHDRYTYVEHDRYMYIHACRT